MTSLVDAESVLAIDIGSLNTRALLFDLVDGQYHFVAAGVGPTTAGLPFRDISEGVHIALQKLQEITGRMLTGTEGSLIIPSQSDGAGVDRLALTCSAGNNLNLMTIGLLSDVSLQSAQRLAGTTYGQVVESIGLNDRRRPDSQLDAILQARPDIVLIAGGTEKGASRSVNKLVEMVATACRLMPKDRRPKVLYCGNGALQKRVKETLERETQFVISPNIRPSIDQEDITSAQTLLAKMTAKMRVMQIGGLETLASLSSSQLLPSAYAMGRMMRFSSELSEPIKPTLGVDLGANTTTMAVASNGNLELNVFRPLGMGGGLQAALEQSRIADILRWIPYDLPAEEVRDYLFQKSLYPASLPMTPEALAIEQAMARQILSLATQKMLERWPDLALSFQRIWLSGATLAQAPLPSQTLMMLLDGLQPVGINVLMLDPYGLSQALGAIAGSNTVLPAQIIESGAYVILGTVICPISHARPGTTIMKLKITYEEGNDVRVEVKQGSIVPLPIRNGQWAHVEVETSHGTVFDPILPRILPRTKRWKITGGLCGALVDARGRPLKMPEDPTRRREQLLRWTQQLEERHT